jgi:hypothetical protein
MLAVAHLFYIFGLNYSKNALFEALETKAQGSGTLATFPHFSQKRHFTGRAWGVYYCGAKAMTDSCYRFITSHNYDSLRYPLKKSWLIRRFHMICCICRT